MPKKHLLSRYDNPHCSLHMPHTEKSQFGFDVLGCIYMPLQCIGKLFHVWKCLFIKKIHIKFKHQVTRMLNNHSKYHQIESVFVFWKMFTNILKPSRNKKGQIGARRDAEFCRLCYKEGPKNFLAAPKMVFFTAGSWKKTYDCGLQVIEIKEWSSYFL